MNLVFEGPELERQLSEAATQVLETMFFASVEEVDAGEDPVATEVSAERIGASLDFHGASTGRLSLSLDLEAAEGLATSFFGEVGQHGLEEDCRTVMAELTNMVCGAMLSHLDKHSIFCLDSPHQLEEGEEVCGDIVRVIRIEQGLLRLAFSLASSRRVDAA